MDEQGVDTLWIRGATSIVISPHMQLVADVQELATGRWLDLVRNEDVVCAHPISIMDLALDHAEVQLQIPGQSASLFPGFHPVVLVLEFVVLLGVRSPSSVHGHILNQLNDQMLTISGTIGVVHLSHHSTCLSAGVHLLLELSGQCRCAFVAATAAALDIHARHHDLIGEVWWWWLADDQALFELHVLDATTSTALKDSLDTVLDGATRAGSSPELDGAGTRERHVQLEGEAVLSW